MTDDAPTPAPRWLLAAAAASVLLPTGAWLRLSIEVDRTLAENPNAYVGFGGAGLFGATVLILGFLLLVTLPVLAALVASLARRRGALPRWAVASAGLTLLGLLVAVVLPFLTGPSWTNPVLALGLGLSGGGLAVAAVGGLGPLRH